MNKVTSLGKKRCDLDWSRLQKDKWFLEGDYLWLFLTFKEEPAPISLESLRAWVKFKSWPWPILYVPLKNFQEEKPGQKSFLLKPRGLKEKIITAGLKMLLKLEIREIKISPLATGEGR